MNARTLPVSSAAGYAAAEVAHAIRCTVGALTVTAAPIHPYRSREPRPFQDYAPLKARTA